MAWLVNVRQKRVVWSLQMQTIRHVQTLTKHRPAIRGVLFLAYSNQHLKLVDRVMSDSGRMDQYAIVLDAPKWFFELKKKTWSNHCLFSPEELAGMPRINDTIFRFEGGKIISSTNAEALLTM